MYTCNIALTISILLGGSVDILLQFSSASWSISGGGLVRLDGTMFGGGLLKCFSKCCLKVVQQVGNGACLGNISWFFANL